MNQNVLLNPISNQLQHFRVHFSCTCCYVTKHLRLRNKSKKVLKACDEHFISSNKIFFKSLRVHFNVTKRIFFQSQFSRNYSKHFCSKASAHSKFYLALVFIPPNPIMMCCTGCAEKDHTTTVLYLYDLSLRTL